jgi:hypothetical protein
MKHLLAAGTAFALCIGIASAAETSPAPLRTLVYHVTLAVRTVNLQHDSGMAYGSAGETINGPGSGTTEQVGTSDDDGRLTVNVIAATGDGGLVVDARFDGKLTQPPLRVAIYQDGRLAFDPSKRLSIEAARILPLLARGFVAGKDVAPGVTLTLGSGANTMRYDVTGANGDRATMALRGELTPGMGAREHDEGTTVYDTAKLCPLNLDLRARIDRSVRLGTEERETQTLSATLLSDSFTKPR